MRHLCFVCLMVFHTAFVFAEILHVGPGQPYATLSEAANVAEPGDIIRIHEGSYPGGIFIGNLQGTESAWIEIEAAAGEEVVFQGGTNAWQMTDAAYLRITGIIFEGQTGNGVNFDDGGSYETPAHHVEFINCTFADIDASGNNDLLKLSGLDFFAIRQCNFINGAAGGSGIDMVGCHHGEITGNYFENMGSNAVQAKGGTSQILMQGNFFKNAGQRSLNLGGSTGLEFFRPIDAPYEAAQLWVYSNVFIGSMAPIAFVGSIECEVINNTIYHPDRWAIRILQETVDPDRFPPCGYNVFRNNIVVVDDALATACNIGPNTAPETFTFSNNLWYHSDNPNWAGPTLPVEDENQLLNLDPLLADVGAEDFRIQAESPAVGQGFDVDLPAEDFTGFEFASPRSIGAFEGDTISTSQGHVPSAIPVLISPNPASNVITFSVESLPFRPTHMSILNAEGKILGQISVSLQQTIITHDIQHLHGGCYRILLQNNRQFASGMFCKM